MAAGYICLLMGGLWLSRLLKYNLKEDVFNNENESFMQETRLLTNDYSVNLPTRFYYKKKWNKGWINVVNPFRATIVLGTPGSGNANIHQLRKKRMKPTASTVQIFFQVIFSSLTPVVPKHDKARRTNANILV